MASAAAGKYSGVAKGATIVPVRYETDRPIGKPTQPLVFWSAYSTFQALLWMYKDITSKQRNGKAVLSLSFGLSPTRFADP
jgi:hypothetical protein